MSNSKKHYLGMLVSAGVLFSVFAFFAVGNMNSFFGGYIPKDMLLGITSPLSVGFVVLAVALHRQRKNPEVHTLLRTLSWFLSYALFVIGWRFVALEFKLPGNIADDGYTITGGFMMLISGLSAGYLLGTTKLKGKK